MLQIQEAVYKIASLSIYRGVLEQGVPKAFIKLLRTALNENPEPFLVAWGELFSTLSAKNAETKFSWAFTEPVLYDENAFSLAHAGGGEPSSLIQSAAMRDLKILKELSAITAQDIFAASTLSNNFNLPFWENGQAIEPLKQEQPEEWAVHLKEFYKKNGCGYFARNRAFIWRNGILSPVLHPDPTLLKDLKGYELQRGMVLENTSAFVKGLPANNCLLYGDRGTGKSSTVKALLHEFPTLRLIEMPKADIPQFPQLVELLAGLPMRFIVFIDDLSFSKQDDTYASLKAVLEGGLASRPENTLIYATSNRRHLLRETFSDREGDEIHRGDTIQESLSLADRFGLSVRFMLPDKAQYLDIIEKLAHQHGITEHLPELFIGAERFALERAGRSPRCAQQYIRLVESRIRQGKSIL